MNGNSAGNSAGKTVEIQLPSFEAHALWAETYDRNPNPLLALEERIVGPMLPSLGGMTVLDVACGTGRWLARLFDYGPRVAVGLDLSYPMLQQARCKPRLRNRLIQADAMEIPIGDAAADFAISSFAVGYAPDVHGLASELSRAIGNGGRLLLSDFHPSAHVRGWKRSFRHNGNIVEITSHNRSVDLICDAFAAQGFDLISRIEAGFGEAERRVFEQHGKGHLFEELCRDVAIFVCYFRRNAERILP